MEPKKVGRALGIGVRVASNMVRQRVAQAGEAPSAPITKEIASPAPFSTTNGRTAAPRTAPGATSGSVPAASAQKSPSFGVRAGTAKRGLKAFGQAFLGPFTHAGSILWLEITGMFFGLFALFFVQSVYRVRTAWRHGPDHTHLLLYVLLAAGFGWFSISSFTRAYRKSKRGPDGGARARP
jgi:hypothetical protein